jgi:hypothetical protein
MTRTSRVLILGGVAASWGGLKALGLPPSDWDVWAFWILFAAAVAISVEFIWKFNQEFRDREKGSASSSNSDSDTR